MNKLYVKSTKSNKFGTRKPKATKKNLLIRKAVKKAFHDYKKAYQRLAFE